jgi:opacity protein-like surface antigen
MGLGARANITVPVENLKIVPSFDYFFPPSIPGASTSYMERNGNAHYSFPLENNPKLLPYAGGGLDVGRVSASGGGVTVSETKVGLNLLGGVQFGSLGSLRPFAEMRYSTTYDGQFIIGGGVNF